MHVHKLSWIHHAFWLKSLHYVFYAFAHFSVRITKNNNNNNLEAVLLVAASRTAQSNAVTHCVAAHISSFIGVGEPPNVRSGDPCVKGCVGTARWVLLVNQDIFTGNNCHYPQGKLMKLSIYIFATKELQAWFRTMLGMCTQAYADKRAFI